MSYHHDLDEYTETELRAELSRRVGMRDVGACDYCGGTDYHKPCQFPGRHRASVMSAKPATVEDVAWSGDVEVWTWPFTTEQMARLAECRASPNGEVHIVAVGPDRADLILMMPIVGAGIRDTFGEGADLDGAEWCVRFGSMSIEAFERLPEHEGW